MLEDLISDNLVDETDNIERVIEGGEDENQDGSGYKESDNEDKKAENETDKDKEKTKVKRKMGPRPVINVERLKGPRGIGIMETFFSDIKLQGKGKEKEDLDAVMKRLEHWTHRLCPRMQFDDSLKKIEKLGSKKIVANYVKRIRLGMEDDVCEERPMNDEPDSPPPPEVDPFDQLLSGSSVPARPGNTGITAEQREQMLRNRLIAEERRAARIKRAQEMQENHNARIECPQETSDTEVFMDIDEINAAIDLESKRSTHTEIQKTNTDTVIENYKSEVPADMDDNERDITGRQESNPDVREIPEGEFNSLERGSEGLQIENVKSEGKNNDFHSEETSDTEELMDIDEITAAIESGIKNNAQDVTGKTNTDILIENDENELTLGVDDNDPGVTAINENDCDIIQETENQVNTTDRDEYASDVVGRLQIGNVKPVGDNNDVYIQLPEETNDSEVLMDINEIAAAIELGIKENSQSGIGKAHADTQVENKKSEVPLDVPDNESDTTATDEPDITQRIKNKFLTVERDECESDLFKGSEDQSQVIRTYENNGDDTEIRESQQDFTKETSTEEQTGEERSKEHADKPNLVESSSSS